MTDWHTLDGDSDLFIEDDRECGLPGIECTTCGNTWAEAGVIYPTVDCRALPMAESLVPGTVTPERFAELHLRLAGHFGDGRLLPPGTELGRQRSAIRAAPPPVFMFMGCVFVDDRVARDIVQSRLDVPLARTVVRRQRSDRSYVVHEIEAPPVGVIADSTRSEAGTTCPRCGYEDAPGYAGEPLTRASLAGRHMVCLQYPVGIGLFVSTELKTILEANATGATLSFGSVHVV